MFCVLTIALAIAADEKYGVELIYRLSLDGARQSRDEVIAIVRERLKRLDPKIDATLAPHGKDRFVVAAMVRDKKQVVRMKRVIAQPGQLEFRITVEKDSGTFRRALAFFRAARAKGAGIERASHLPVAQLNDKDKAAHPHGLRWFRLGAKPTEFLQKHATREKDGEFWMLVELDAHNLSSRDLRNIGVHPPQLSTDRFTIHFAVKKNAQERMVALTDPPDRRLAIIIDGRVAMAPILKARLRSSGQISGAFTQAEAEALATILQSDPLERKPVLISERTVGKPKR